MCPQVNAGYAPPNWSPPVEQGLLSLQGSGEIRGVVMMSEPVAGAHVIIHQIANPSFTYCDVTTGADGTYICPLGKTYGPWFVEAIGGTTTVNGQTVNLDQNSKLIAPLLNVQILEHRTAVISPLSTLVWELGQARLRAGKEADVDAAVRRAHALVTAHLQVDPVAIEPKPVTATTPFD